MKIASARSKTGREVVYFIQANGGDVKIGKSANLESRVRTLRCSSSASLVVLGVCPNSGDLERSLHRMFQHLRVSGEWFRPGADLLKWISENSVPQQRTRAPVVQEDLFSVEARTRARTMVDRTMERDGLNRENSEKVLSEKLGVPLWWLRHLLRGRVGSISASDFERVRQFYAEDTAYELERVTALLAAVERDFSTGKAALGKAEE